MPEIKIKHVVSFSSEDKVHKAENLIKSETYRQWKCATPGEKNATVVLQFEKATQIHSIDIGNASSAFVEILVGRSSDTVSDYQVLLVASSFMSPLESRTETHTHRVRMFGPEKLSQSTKDEKWDCVQIVCTQPFNSRITYGLSFIKFHSPPEKDEGQSKSLESEMTTTRIGPFKLLKDDDDDDDDDSLLTSGSFFEKQRSQEYHSFSSSTIKEAEPSYASVILASTSDTNKMSPQGTVQKRKLEANNSLDELPVKKASSTALNKEHIIYKDVLRDVPENKKNSETNSNIKKDASKSSENKKISATALSNTLSVSKKNPSTPRSSGNKKTPASLNNSSESNKQGKANDKVPFNKIMDKVIFVLSGFVNPLRSMIRDKALAMGAKYKADWDSSCTHLICAFTNTPKYQQVKQLKGKIVKKEWILDCYKMKKLIPWTRYDLDKSSADDSSSEESDYFEELDDSDEDSDYSEEFDSEEEYSNRKNKRKKQNTVTKVRKKAADTSKKGKTPVSNNKNSVGVSSKGDLSKDSNENDVTIKSNKNDTSYSVKKDNQNDTSYSIKKDTQNDTTDSIKKDNPVFSNHNNSLDTSANTKDESETEDEDALQDYLADTDPDIDAGESTEDEIQKVEMRFKKTGSLLKRENFSEEDSEYSEKPDISDLPLPELPNLFKQRHFYLYGEFSTFSYHDLQRYIIAYNGIIEEYLNNKVKYVITEEKWDKVFEEALGENEDLIFVKPTWIYKCHDTGKLVPYQPYIVIPDT